MTATPALLPILLLSPTPRCSLAGAISLHPQWEHGNAR
jgi:hypothetical protein